ncbi:MAG: hypothetical protein WCI88_04745 [Chloroflexota bacterium]
MFNPGHKVEQIEVLDEKQKSSRYPSENFWNKLILVILLIAFVLVFFRLIIFPLPDFQQRLCSTTVAPIPTATAILPTLSPTKTEIATQATATAESTMILSPEIPSSVLQTSSQFPPTQVLSEALKITPAPTLSDDPLITPAPTLSPLDLTVFPTRQVGYYTPQRGNPRYIGSDLLNTNGNSCNGSRISGQVFNASSEPVTGLTVVVEGKIIDQAVTLTTTSGNAPQYGPAGFEIILSRQPVKSTEPLTVQIYTADGQSRSSKVEFWLYDECDKNVAIVNFIGQ